MFVPIDLLPPILADLLAKGRVAGPGPALARPQRAGSRTGSLVVGRVDAGQPGGEGRAQARRHHRRRQRRDDRARSASSTARSGRCGAAGVDRAARRAVGRQAAPRRGAVGQPARHPQAEVDVLAHHGRWAGNYAALGVVSDRAVDDG